MRVASLVGVRAFALDEAEIAPPGPGEVQIDVRAVGICGSDVHAYAEETLFYPQLLKRGEDDPEEETLDAIGDHNDIRDGVRDANAVQIGSDEWWAAVGRARKANDEHMGEEEREGLSDFRKHAPAGLRESLGRQYHSFMTSHPTTRGLDVSDKDPQAYVDSVDDDTSPPKDSSLGIGSLKGQ
jgi:hypothetical protein